MPGTTYQQGTMYYYVVQGPGYSSESGQDNPFRPDGNLSREADEIVQLIKRGQPVVANQDDESKNHVDDSEIVENPVKATSPDAELTSSKCGSNGSAEELLEAVEVKHVVMATPSDAATVEHVHIKKEKGCCVIQ